MRDVPILQADAGLPNLRERASHDQASRRVNRLVRESGREYLHFQASMFA
ncbi:hypothetical protein CSC34_0656 [Pseudomonas aeruginosa]|nr:hypothetical protein CSC34_0656 [Pseudomonas aeruginosa]